MKKSLLFFSAVLSCSAATIEVGPSRALKTICAAVSAAAPGDTILVDPAVYAGKDAVCRITKPDLTIAAASGKAVTNARDSRNYAINVYDQAIWSVQLPSGTLTVKGIDFTGGAVA